jgi:flavin reductase (DIM6/NTAB) family NADH-FMN oxidoreductase RutF
MTPETPDAPARQPIPLDHLALRSLQVWDEGWFLLTAGDHARGEFNTMTVSWGSFGTIWNLPFAQVVVRPSRHTFGFMERFDTFTLSAFREEHRPALQLLGTKSGREGDKIAEAGLHPQPSTLVAAPCFAEAVLVVECRKIYWQDLDPAHFLDPAIMKNYPQRDYHRAYFGQILAASGTPDHHGGTGQTTG